MVWYALLDEGEKFFTYLASVFEAIENAQINYNFLITGVETGHLDPEHEFLTELDTWISGEALTEIIRKDNFQWIWGALLAFEKEITEEEALASIPKFNGKIPFADEVSYQARNQFQETLATFMIFAFDSTLTELFSRSKELIDTFKKHKPLAKVQAIDGDINLADFHL